MQGQGVQELVEDKNPVRLLQQLMIDSILNQGREQLIDRHG